jgi:hypothetical protein
LEPRFLKMNEEVTGRYREMIQGDNKRLFKLSIGDEEILLPKSVGDSVLRSRMQGNDVLTISRTKDLYEIRPALER